METYLGNDGARHVEAMAHLHCLRSSLGFSALADEYEPSRSGTRNIPVSGV
jgi:hypothetical protein